MNFTLGGAVGRDGFYVERAADAVALKSLASFQSCYIAHPRQSGKSSLRKHVARLLREQGLAVAEIDLTLGGKDPLKKLWGRFEQGIAAEFSRLGHRLKPWSLEYQDDSSERGFGAYIADDVLTLHDRGLILFIDEVNVLGARDDSAAVFAELRALIERRTRFALCFLGVSRPSDLVNEPGADPSPMMRAIVLDDFTREEITSFTPLLAGFRDPQRILSACFAQAGGHPYMLQNILAMAAESRRAGSTEDQASAAGDHDDAAESLIATIVQDRFFRPGSPDPVLEMPHHTFTHALDQRAMDALNLYRGVIVRGRMPVEHDERQQAQEMLRLAGMIRFDATSIVPRNAIFARRYNSDWVRDRLDRPVYETMATRWALEDHHPDFLLHGRALGSATELLGARDQAVSSSVADFIRASAKASEQVDPMITRLRRKLGVALVGIGVVAIVLSAVAINGRIEARRAEYEAMRQSLESELAVTRAKQSSVENLLDSYKRQTADLDATKASLQHKLELSNQDAAKLRQQQDKLTLEYDKARRSQSHEAETIKADLKEVNRRADALADERSRLQGDLDAAKSRGAALAADIRIFEQRLTALNAEVKDTKASLDEEKRQNTDLTAQLQSLKSKIDDVTKQLNDVQAKYGECVSQLSAATREVDAAKSKAATCEVRPQP